MAWYEWVSFLAGIPVGWFLACVLGRSPEAGAFPPGQRAVSEEPSAGPVQTGEPATHPETAIGRQDREAPGLSQILDIIEGQIGSLIAESEKVFSSILHSIGQLQERVRQSLTDAQELGRKIYSPASGDNGGIVGRTLQELVSFSHEAEIALRQVVERLIISRDSCRGIAEKAEKELYGFVEEVGSIAYRTKILALNASILAAHAGEQGKSMEVVAQEVRRLADTAYEAALRVKRMAENIAGAVQEVALDLQDYWDEIEHERQRLDDAVKKADRDINRAAQEVEDLISNLLLEIGGFFQDIDSTIIAGQFQDIARQRWQHVLEILRELGDILQVDGRADEVINRGQLEKTIAGMVEKYTTYIERQNHYATLGVNYEESLGDNVELF
ncbi:MAG: methyl-accepting chemotaxis protein [Moorellaceae bacterium]